MTILQVLRKLGYGGVETYVAKLSKGLAARGHRVLVISGGGPLAENLAEAGVKCLQMELGNLHFWHARRELAQLIEREDVDIMNAHHGSVGITAYLAARSTGVPYLRSVHGTRSAWQRLSLAYWPPKILVVSRASRDNLVEKLGLSPDRIVESFIGVDTTRFSPGEPPPALRAELGVAGSERIILHVSRFSREKSRVGITLAQAAPALLAACPDLTILLVGSGRCEREVRAAADKANAQIGRDAVRLLGARADIPELMRLATVVVGTASVAMEAMASGCSLVAAGLKGFIGTVTPENITKANEGCFGDHAAEDPVTPGSLCDALLPLLADSEGRKRLARWGREMVVQHFSLEKMVEQVEKIYLQMVEEKRKPHS